MFHEALFELRPGGPWYTTKDSWVWEGEEADKPTEAEVQTLSDQYDAARPLKNLREERNKRLTETDWWATSDRTMTAEQTAYRQALRDLPDNTADPANPVWPTKP